MNDSVIMVNIRCTKAHTNSVTKRKDVSHWDWFYDLSSSAKCS